MKIEEIKLADLKAGMQYNFTTKGTLETLEGDLMWIHYSDHIGKIMVWFNGKIMGSYKQLRPAIGKLIALSHKHSLEFMGIENNEQPV